jgi:hypothetical protein
MVRVTRMRVLHREVGLTAENRLLDLDGGKIDRSAEALLNPTNGSAPFPKQFNL